MQFRHNNVAPHRTGERGAPAPQLLQRSPDCRIPEPGKAKAPLAKPLGTAILRRNDIAPHRTCGAHKTGASREPLAPPGLSLGMSPGYGFARLLPFSRGAGWAEAPQWASFCTGGASRRMGPGFANAPLRSHWAFRRPKGGSPAFPPYGSVIQSIHRHERHAKQYKRQRKCLCPYIPLLQYKGTH